MKKLFYENKERVFLGAEYGSEMIYGAFKKIED